MHESQKERGTSAGFIGSSGKKFADKLAPQRQLTDKEQKRYTEALEKIDLSRYPQSLSDKVKTIDEMLKKLPSIRSRVDSLSISAAEQVDFSNTTNLIEGGVFSPLKILIKIHRGLSKSLKLKIVDDYLVSYKKRE